MRSFGIPAGIVVIALVTTGVVLASSAGRVQQPIAFSHKKHIEDVGSTCTDCHLYAQTGVRATIPNVETCSICHVEPLTESPAEQLLVQHIQDDEPIRWVKVNRLPAHVFFSHRRHTQVAEIECSDCHGDVAQAVSPFSRPLRRNSMGRCMDCHEDRGATNDCIACHR